MELVNRVKSTRGANSREITFPAIGAFRERKIAREKDENGVDLGKDAEGKLITREEIVQEFYTEGVITSIDDALALVDGNLQTVLDYFAEGFNRASYIKEASKDELDELLAGQNLDEDKLKAFKRAVRQIMAVTNKSAAEAVEMLIG
jgi:hypothetical protein